MRTSKKKGLCLGLGLMFKHSVTRAERLGNLKSIKNKASSQGTQVRSTATPDAEEGFVVFNNNKYNMYK